MNDAPYRALAKRLNDLPNGFPPTEDGAELRLLAKLFSPEEAALAARLRWELETPVELALRVGGDAGELAGRLKGMAKRGLIRAGRVTGGLGYGIMPFMVGIYEMQLGRIDEELSQLFEAYYRQAAPAMLAVQPQFHRIIPVNQTVDVAMEIHPYESVAEIVAGCRSWGVVDCICRVERALVGQPCAHPVDVCMVLSTVEQAFDRSTTVKALTMDEAVATLERAADAGLVHSVTNSQDGVWYICNCCTCSCGILRGMAELGVANVIARSAFVCHADEDDCASCEACVEACQFGALSLAPLIAVGAVRCVGCGVCVGRCPEGALGLRRRPESEVAPPPASDADWRARRAAARGLDLAVVD